MDDIETSTLTPSILLPYLNPVFVETGTWKGGGIACALEVGFPSIYSIELDEGLAKRAQDKYDQCHIVCGDSALVLYDLIKDIQNPITFFLDSHKQCPNQSEESPLAEELEQISRHSWHEHHTILIDDIRLIAQWKISKDQLINLAHKIKSKPSISYINNRCFENDIMVIK